MNKTVAASFFSLGILCKKENQISDTGTRTRVSCVHSILRGKYANHLHHIGVQHV